jgi:hypothetical protein
MNVYPDIIRSPLCQTYSDGDITVSVEIYRLSGTDGWSLEVVDSDGGSTVWQEPFATDAAALAEFHQGVKVLGLATLISPTEEDGETVH